MIMSKNSLKVGDTFKCVNIKDLAGCCTVLKNEGYKLDVDLRLLVITIRCVPEVRNEKV